MTKPGLEMRVCRCGLIIPATRKHCDRCARADSARRRERTKRDGRNTQAWQRTRELVLIRDDHQCRQCGAHATGVHRVGGGYHHTTDLDQYVALCPPCHGRIDRARQHATGGAPIPPRDAGSPKPPTSSPREKLDGARKNVAQPCGLGPLVA